jgi:hypothetical protein
LIGLDRIRGRSCRPWPRLAPLAIGLLGLLTLLLGDGAAPRAAAQVAAPAGEVTPRTDDSLPLSSVTMIGSSPAEASDETWGIGKVGAGASAFPFELVRYTREGGWTLGPQLQDLEGKPLQGFKPDEPSGLVAPSPLAGQMTVRGSGVLVGTAPPEAGAKPQQVVLVRSPGGAFQQTAPVEEALLPAGETLFATKRSPLVAPLDEEAGRGGALIVPYSEGTESAVLHWDGSKWTREAIEVPGSTSREKEESGFQVLAIGASSPGNAWLLAQPSSAAETLALYRREEGIWKPVAATLEVGGESLFVAGSPERIESQLITVTSQGLWIDAERPAAHALTTVFVEPEGAESGSIKGSWCLLSSGEGCKYELPEDLPAELPTGPSRSFAWANPSASTPYGERVITGLKEGVSLRLEGTTFKRVLSLGGSTAPEDVGGSFGAAFSSAREGWLGSDPLPVHLSEEAAHEQRLGESSLLANWSVPFRHALFAIAPQPGAPVGASSSEALAVGDSGEVARYEPGEGWLPESLLGPGGRRETPRLRAVAWPTSSRAYAVGDSTGNGSEDSIPMWLWRSETGLWEPDPATPLNFRGNLLGIAFDPEDSALGFAVGTGGVLLRYGKTWTQEALPEAARGASFTSIAFAGSEAIVAFHQNHEQGPRTGGLLLNSGSGWHIDEGAAAAMGTDVPVTVAALPDGGAAVATIGIEGAAIFERNEPGGSWAATAVPLPLPAVAPGSLALFREAGALRVITAGVAAIGAEVLAAPPPGFPPTLEEPAPVPTGQQERGVVRQTADGWSDEEHELNPVKEPPVGPYKQYDTVYEPDPVGAVMVSPSGGEGWAVGGFVESDAALDTSDVERYEANPAEQPTQPGRKQTAHPLAGQQQEVTLAVGGGAQCGAPCADRARAGIGPDVWLENALHEAADSSYVAENVSAFLYTGPRLSTGQTEGSEPAFPFSRELERYAELLAGSPLAAYAAASPTDLDARPRGGTEATFLRSLLDASLPQSALTGTDELSTGEQSEQADTPGAQAAYYSFTEHSPNGGGAVRVMMLDDTGQVGAQQLLWLKAQLGQAAAAKEVAIAVGNADLNAQLAAGNDPEAEAVVAALISGEASAYFYDSPEENTEAELTLPRLEAQLYPPGEKVPPHLKSYGSGTLGYIDAAKSDAEFQASGFLIAHVAVDLRGQGEFAATPNRAPVSVVLIPNIGELALEAEEGTLLRRSDTALFAGLARRPRAGNRSESHSVAPDTDPYIQIPSECVGIGCPPESLRPVYTFSSSNPNVGDFVERNTASAEPKAVEVAADGDPVEAHGTSGLFCAYEQGTTEVTISAGGLSASLLVTVEGGSQRRPCIPPHPHTQLPSQQQQAATPPPAPNPTPAGPAPAAAPPVVPLPPAPAALAPPAPPAARPALPLPYFFPGPPLAPVLAFVPPPVPTPARPTPPTGTSAVTSPIEVAEREEEQEQAPESVSNQATAYRASEHEPASLYILGVVVLAAFAGASARRGPRRGRREVRVAPATINTMRDRRLAKRGRRRW